LESKITPGTFIEAFDAISENPSLITIGATSILLNKHSSVLFSLTLGSDFLSHLVIVSRDFSM
jgi:hypothetical protein